MRWTNAIFWVPFIVSSAAMAREATLEIAEPAPYSLRLGLDVGGVYSTNVYQISPGEADLVGLVSPSLDADLLLSNEAIFKVAYSGALEMYADVEELRSYGQLFRATLGYRLHDRVYGKLSGGVEHAYYPSGDVFTFFGGFGGAGLRWEAGESATLEGTYRFRNDLFPSYDLDNRSHQADVLVELAVGDHLELRLPLTYQAKTYTERFLRDAAGAATDTNSSATFIALEPGIEILPSFDWRIAGAVGGVYNDSDDTYSPVPDPQASTDPDLSRQFYSYSGVGTRWSARWLASDSVTLVLRLEAGIRRFSDRFAESAFGVTTTEKQEDFWVQPGIEARARVASALSIGARYAYLLNQSNDYLWDFAAHRVQVTLGTWWDSGY